MPEISAFSPETVSTAAGMTLDLRPLAASDTDAWIAHVRADLEHLGQHLGWPSRTIDPDAARRFIARYSDRDGGRMLLLGAFARQRLVGGTVLMSYEPRLGSVEIGCWVVTELEGQRVARGMCVATLAFARATLGAHRVEWRCATGNARSRQLAASLGFIFEGCLRDAGLHLGERQDLDVLSLVGFEIDAALQTRS